MTLPGTQFRWLHHDASMGDEWTDWHSAEGPCAACCCGGPEEGEHQQPEEYYDEDGFLAVGHTRLDLRTIGDYQMEWRP